MKETSINHIAEVKVNETRHFDLDMAIDSVIRDGLYISQLGDETVDNIANNIPKPKDIYEKDWPGWKLEQGQIFDREELVKFWEQLAPNFGNIRLVNTVLNTFRPGDYIPKHIDINPGPSGMLEVGGEDGFLEEVLTFLYTAKGEKDILLYTNGPNNPPLSVRQQPGQMIVFPMASIANTRGELLIPELYHEVPEQGTSCTTLTWEIMRQPITPKY